MSLLLRIIRAHQKQAGLRVPGELHAKDGTWFLKWDNHALTLWEAPARSKNDPLRRLDPERGAKSVRWNWDWRFATPNLRYPVLHNVLPQAGLKISDTAAAVRIKLQQAFDAFISWMQEKGAENIADSERWVPQVEEWLRGYSRSYPWKINWYKSLESPAAFVPKTMKPFKAKGRNFEITVAPDEFKVFSRYENYGSGDPSYSGYKSKSPAAARKLYNLLVANPEALKDVTMDQFTTFLARHKIPYDYVQSVWH